MGGNVCRCVISGQQDTPRAVSDVQVCHTLSCMNVSAVIGERVHTLMWRRRIEQRTVSAALGMTQPALSRKLRGQRLWSVEELVEVAAYLGVPVTDLLPAEVASSGDIRRARQDSNLQPSDPKIDTSTIRRPRGHLSVVGQSR